MVCAAASADEGDTAHQDDDGLRPVGRDCSTISSQQPSVRLSHRLSGDFLVDIESQKIGVKNCAEVPTVAVRHCLGVFSPTSWHPELDETNDMIGCTLPCYHGLEKLGFSVKQIALF